ncbi:putative F-box domain, leucine-rich repeat domain, L domain-containing protein [Medicago truncatula]|uniref:Putative F-box domain, leucine-rich repeat domain, L domain-containing protein n=1 Tax=Medicago truncatula TaxID=3880 RepID=A0A072U8W3_MEDTR|nr:F-box/LRR-repeat protein 7 [Medicago truncatula]KEH25538.1 RNI superfamily protein, putative [Medicago truncatula]RHN50733.1 putative F-box domain, leucine-rich repeat domain, L domain-containing protein [Medicago truncatula]
MQFSHQQKRRRKTTTVVVADDFYLPDECWESIFKFLNDGANYRELKSLSLVSKLFLSITNRLVISLTVYNNGIGPFLGSILGRFTNLTSLKIKRYKRIDFNVLLGQISRFPLKLSSLNLSNHRTIPAGLRAFSQNITTLTSFTSSRMGSINSNDLLLIAECFPLLEELNLCYPRKFKDHSFLNRVETLSLTLFKLTKINLSGHHYINDTSLFNLFKNCKLLQEVIMFRCRSITKVGIVSALCERPTLRSLSFTNYFEIKNIAMLYELVGNYPLLSEIKMEYAPLSEISIENSNSLMNFAVRPQLKSLGLVRNWLRDKNIKRFASIFPNLQLLDLSGCCNISNEGILQVLRRCGNIRHLNLACTCVTLDGLNFEVPKLEVLNLSYTGVFDEILYEISKNCRGLLQLLLQCCHNVRDKGVMHVVGNCLQLKEINLRRCHRVHANIVDDMVFSRPSLSKIKTPPGFDLCSKNRELFLRNGCLVY